MSQIFFADWEAFLASDLALAAASFAKMKRKIACAQDHK